MSTSSSHYASQLHDGFKEYRNRRFAREPSLFELRPAGGPVVFRRNHADKNILVPPSATDDVREQIMGAIPPRKRHRYFASMRSSQALAQSVFGTIQALNRLPLLSSIQSEDGRPAFGSTLDSSSLILEKSVEWLGEPRPTSIDAWISNSDYRVAVECKLAENAFGQCSRPHLTADDAAFEREYCDGNYTRQRGRAERCALTEIKVRYWDYLEALVGWRLDIDQQPCPLRKTYQLVRNALAASVQNGILDTARGHALIIYDQRNPTMWLGGYGAEQWKLATETLRNPGVLRRISWQAFIGQWPRDEVLDWLRKELSAKFGFT
jgi:Restriction Endonuclease associating with ARP